MGYGKSNIVLGPPWDSIPQIPHRLQHAESASLGGAQDSALTQTSPTTAWRNRGHTKKGGRHSRKSQICIMVIWLQILLAAGVWFLCSPLSHLILCCVHIFNLRVHTHLPTKIPPLYDIFTECLLRLKHKTMLQESRIAQETYIKRSCDPAWQSLKKTCGVLIKPPRKSPGALERASPRSQTWQMHFRQSPRAKACSSKPCGIWGNRRCELMFAVKRREKVH